MGDRVRRVIAALGRLSTHKSRVHAMARLDALEQRVMAILTKAEADRAQHVVKETGRRG